ncbi:small ribosomal subunit protein bS6m-like [Haliotis cracherodii]|uniref:small ribosomal subunit protein bS6m-like n=1 Tax=Haliotis cracherodii TaxID=6455 RepID=UPI0039EA8D29
MPSYEMSLIIKAALKRPELSHVIRRTCESLIGKGGIIRSMENLGLRPLPYKMACQGKKQTEGNYVLINFDSSPESVTNIQDDLKRDVDIIRPSILRRDEDFVRPCLRGPCLFNELPNPDHERRVWKRRVLKKVHMTRKDKERLL